MNALLRLLGRDPLERELAPLLRCEIDPRAIVSYGLPAYKDYQFRKGGLLARRLRKLASQRKRRLLIQDEDYLRLGTFSETETYRFLSELWEAGFDYRQVERYREFAARLAAGETIRLRSKRVVIADRAGLDSYFEEYVGLLRSMRDQGYRTSGSEDRIMIMIDRDGGIMKETKGRHRLAAAQIVGVPAVPVLISHVHAAWVDAQAGPGATTRAEQARRAIRRTLASLERARP